MRETVLRRRGRLGEEALEVTSRHPPILELRKIRSIIISDFIITAAVITLFMCVRGQAHYVYDEIIVSAYRRVEKSIIDFFFSADLITQPYWRINETNHSHVLSVVSTAFVGENKNTWPHARTHTHTHTWKVINVDNWLIAELLLTGDCAWLHAILINLRERR